MPASLRDFSDYRKIDASRAPNSVSVHAEVTRPAFSPNGKGQPRPGPRCPFLHTSFSDDIESLIQYFTTCL